MIEKEVAKKFIGKNIGLLHRDGDKDFFIQGFVEKVTDISILIIFKGKLQAYDLKAIQKIREM